MDCISKQFFASVEMRVDYFFFKLPKSFHQVQIRRIWMQKNLFDAGISQPLRRFLISVIPCIVRDDEYFPVLRKSFQDFLIKFFGVLSVYSFTINSNYIRYVFCINYRVDLNPVSAAYSRLFKVFSFFYPYISGARMMSGMNSIGIMNNCLFV